jgi:HEAT repeat protein
MGLIDFCLLPLLLVQAPQAPAAPAPRATIDTVDPATWLPANCLVAVTLAPTATSTTADRDAWQRLAETDRTGLLRSASDELGTALQGFGLEVDDLADLPRGGIAAGLVGLRNEGSVRAILVARAPAKAERLQAALAAAARDQSAETVTLAGAKCHRFSFGPQPLLACVRGEHLVVGTDDESLTTTLGLLQQGSARSLAGDDDYVAAVTTSRGTGRPLATVFVRVATLVNALAGTLPEDAREPFAHGAHALQLDAAGTAMVRLLIDGDHLETTAQLALPGAKGLLAAVLGDPTRLGAHLGSLVPAQATGFTLSTLDLGGVVHEAIQVVGAVQPGAGVMLSAMIDEFGQRCGIDVRATLLQGFSGQNVGVEFERGFGALCGLRNGEAFAKALTSVLRASGLPLRQATVSGVTAHRFEPGREMPLSFVFATTGDWLCFADTDENLERMLKQTRSPRPNAQVAAALRDAPPGTTMLQEQGMGAGYAVATRTDLGLAMRSRFTVESLAQMIASMPVAARNRRPAQPTERVAIARTEPVEQPETPVAEPPPASQDDGTAPPDPAEVEALAAAERAGARVDPSTLVPLVHSANAAIATRATWLLGSLKNPATFDQLASVAGGSPHADARFQAIAALLRGGEPRALTLAIAALDDSDRRVRTAGAQLLGRLRNQASATSLLALLDRGKELTEDGAPATDLQAALLALNDMGARPSLLPAAMALNEVDASAGAGEALTFFFQTHSPELGTKEELTLLLAVLDHREPLLRRYAIERIGELKDPMATSALEQRLPRESAELKPLLEVSLAAVRRDRDTPPGDEIERAKANLKALATSLQQRWNALDDQQRMIAAGAGAGGLLLVFCVFALWRRARRRAKAAAAAAATAAMVAPSDEYLSEMAEKAEALAEEAEQLADEPAEAAAPQARGLDARAHAPLRR